MEFFVEDMKNLPKVVEKRLKELRQMDSASNKSLLTLNDEGNKIFEELAELSKANPDFDEAPIREKFQALLGKRGSTLTALDEQMKKITKLYDLVDGRIAFLDTCTKDVSHLFPQVPGERGMGMRKKKKKKSSAADALSLSADDAFAEAAPMSAYDPNEPLYCTCRQISHGQMVACDNEDCPFEWFHYSCVGLKEEPEEKWYCDQCSQKM